MSDQGSQLKAGAQIVTDFLKDVEVDKYLKTHNIKGITFEQFYTGNSALASTVESLNKQIKKLIYNSINKTVLSYPEFEYLICYITHIINRRPIALQSALRGSPDGPSAVTPELVIRGYHLPSLNILPDLHIDPDHVGDPDWTTDVDTDWKKLKDVRQNVIKLYNTEFQQTLLQQSVNKKNRYKPVPHTALANGDIVLVKEPNTKVNNYPLAKVWKI